MTWVVVLDTSGDGSALEAYGPYATEEDCYQAAAQVSRQPNDWTPLELRLIGGESEATS